MQSSSLFVIYYVLSSDLTGRMIYVCLPFGILLLLAMALVITVPRRIFDISNKSDLATF